VDREASPLASARNRGRERHVPNVAFAQGEFENLPPSLGGFDAVVGRRVLMYQPDAARAVWPVASGPAGSLSSRSTILRWRRPVWCTCRSTNSSSYGFGGRSKERARISMGFRLYGALTQAELSAAKCANQSKRLVSSSGGLPAMVVPMTTSIVQPRRETNREVNSTSFYSHAEQRGSARPPHYGSDSQADGPLLRQSFSMSCEVFRKSTKARTV
jgi:hypothetical protein